MICVPGRRCPSACRKLYLLRPRLQSLLASRCDVPDPWWFPTIHRSSFRPNLCIFVLKFLAFAFLGSPKLSPRRSLRRSAGRRRRLLLLFLLLLFPLQLRALRILSAYQRKRAKHVLDRNMHKRPLSLFEL